MSRSVKAQVLVWLYLWGYVLVGVGAVWGVKRVYDASPPPPPGWNPPRTRYPAPVLPGRVRLPPPPAA